MRKTIKYIAVAFIALILLPSCTKIEISDLPGCYSTTPPDIDYSSNIVVGTNTTFSVYPYEGKIYKWYDQNDNLVHTGNAFTTFVGGLSSIYNYYVVEYDGDCASDKAYTSFSANSYATPSCPINMNSFILNGITYNTQGEFYELDANYSNENDQLIMENSNVSFPQNANANYVRLTLYMPNTGTSAQTTRTAYRVTDEATLNGLSNKSFYGSVEINVASGANAGLWKSLDSSTGVIFINSSGNAFFCGVGMQKVGTTQQLSASGYLKDI